MLLHVEAKMDQNHLTLLNSDGYLNVNLTALHHDIIHTSMMNGKKGGTEQGYENL